MSITQTEKDELLQRVCAAKNSKKCHFFRIGSSTKTLCGQPSPYGYGYGSTKPNYNRISDTHSRWPTSIEDVCSTCRKNSDATLILAALTFASLPKAVRTVLVMNVRIRKVMTISDLMDFADEIKKAATAVQGTPADAVEIKLNSY